jgi:excisionase family DNA binding protein
MNDDRLMNADEVSRLLGCHSQHVYRLASAGTLPSLKLGKWRRFRAADLAAWIESRAGANDAK